MAYELFKINLGGGHAESYVLKGTDQHEGTHEPISAIDMHHYATDKAKLASFLDYRFLRAHGERIGREMAMAELKNEPGT